MTGPARVVVVGHGMVGARFVDEVLERDPERRIDLTVLGAEPEGAYNRVLLSEVVAGRADPAALGLADPARLAAAGVDVRTATAAVGVDLAARTVRAGDGTLHRYDTLVLATGARPVRPSLGRVGEGAAHEPLLPEGVHTFRTLADCRRIVAAAAGARRAVVLGGGVLGLEAARGLAGRAIDVTVVHRGPHLLDRHLDAGAAAVLTATVRRLGVDVRVRSGPGAALAVRAGRVRGVDLEDGTRLPADLVVLACGVRRDTALATRAGVAGRSGGVAVDDRLRSPREPAVAAIGDCAEHRGTSGGLVAPGWEQARVLADLVTGTDPGARYRGSTPVLRLKAADLDVLSLGSASDLAVDPYDPPAGTRVVQLADAGEGMYVKVVLRAGAVVAATVVGAARAASELLLLADRALPAPGAQALLFPGAAAPAAAGAGDPLLAPAESTVCRCNGVAKAALVDAWAGGARSVADLAARTRATTGCGDCRDRVEGLCRRLAETGAA